MRSRGLCPLLLLAVLTPSLLCRPAAAAEGSSSDRRLTVAIEPFADHAADPRFAPLLAGLPELLAFALTDEERVVATARRERFSVTAEEEAAPSFETFGGPEERDPFDLILKGQIFTYRGRVRLRGQLVPPAGGSVREVSSEMVEVERIFAGIDRFVEALRAEIADIRRGSLPNLVVLPCFAEAGEPPTGDLSWLASELPSSVLSHLDLESVDLELGSGVEEGCREPGESLGEIFERLEPAGLVLGTYALGEPMTVTASLLTGEERPPIQIAWLQRSFSSLLELERNLAADIGAALGAVARGGGKWQPEPLLDLPADVEGLLQAAEASLGKEETLFRAVLLFSRAVQADPDRAAGHLGLGLARSQQGRHREATGHFRRAIELDGASARAHRELGRSLFELGREEEALEILGTALDLDPESVETWRLLAEINGLIGDAQEAIAQYREVLERDPGDTEASRRLAEILQLAGREDEAEEVLQDGLQNNPGDPLLLSALAEIYFARGRRLATDGDYRAALGELRRAAPLRSNPVDPRWIIFAHNQLQEWGEAARVYYEAVETGETDAGVFNNGGWALVALGRMEAAGEAFARATQLEPGLVEAWSGSATVAREQGRYSDALIAFERALWLRPDDARLLSALGVTAALQKRADRALAYFEQALDTAPGSAEVHNEYSFALAELERYGEAVEAAETAIALDPEYANPYNHRGFSLHRLGRTEEGLDQIRRAIDIDPGYGGAYYNLARIAMDRNDPAEALEQLSRAIEATGVYRYRARLDDAFRGLRGQEIFEELVTEPAEEVPL